MRHGRKCLGIVAVDNQTCHLIAIIGNDVLDQERLERYICQGHLSGDALLVVARSDACEIVA
jgi:hypothetical protein